jgi:predicted Zn-dependent protease with MMP-like domain
MSREAMQMALEALESVTGHFTRTPSTLRDSEVRGEAHKAITVLRQALVDADDTLQKRVDEKEKREHEWVGLTDEEIHDLIYVSQKIDASNSPWFDCLGFYRAVEQVLKEKNHG